MTPEKRSGGRAEEAVIPCQGLQWNASQGLVATAECLSVEEPLSIEVAYERSGQRVRKALGITMRTPGNDEELALGFVFAEGLIRRLSDVKRNTRASEGGADRSSVTWCVELSQPPPTDLFRTRRTSVTTSACGLCGRANLDGLPLGSGGEAGNRPILDCSDLASLPGLLLSHQKAFRETGGCHGAGLCDTQGGIVLVREDVGRHNAVDKLIGAALLKGLDFRQHTLVLSGRASFELVQKAAAAEIPVIVAVGAPSSLAVKVAHSAGITLAGFARGSRLTLYTHVGRMQFAAAAPSEAPILA